MFGADGSRVPGCAEDNEIIITVGGAETMVYRMKNERAGLSIGFRFPAMVGRIRLVDGRFVRSGRLD
jgi:hypothetical protein